MMEMGKAIFYATVVICATVLSIFLVWFTGSLWGLLGFLLLGAGG